MRLLCVDFGNICRGPMAEAVLRVRLPRAGIACEVDSAGVSIVTPGARPDERAVRAAGLRGYSLDGIRCRQLAAADLARFDRILAVDRYVLESVYAMIAPGAGRAALAGFLHPEGVEILDPHDGTIEDFEDALDLIEEAADGIAARLMRSP